MDSKATSALDGLSFAGGRSVNNQPLKIQKSQQPWHDSAALGHDMEFPLGEAPGREEAFQWWSDVREVDSIRLTAAPKADFGSNSQAIIL